MQTPKKKKRKKKSKLQKKKENPFSGYWLNKCDSIFRPTMHSIWIRDNVHYCLICGKIPPECAHLIPIENYLYRFEPRNTIQLCSDHHKFNREISAHAAPVQFGLWLIKNYPEKAEFVKKNKECITRKIELPWTFKEKYYQLLEWRKKEIGE